MNSKWSRPRPLLPFNQLYADKPLYIAELQRFIRAIPTPDGGVRLIAIDGIYGPETRQAVADFQTDYGLPSTGRADNRTWDMLFDEYERNTAARRPAALPILSHTLTTGSSGADVLTMQAMINQLADRFANITPVPYTGDYDEATAESTAQLQRILRLPADGDTDSRTWQAVFSLL